LGQETIVEKSSIKEGTVTSDQDGIKTRKKKRKKSKQDADNESNSIVAEDILTEITVNQSEIHRKKKSKRKALEETIVEDSSELVTRSDEYAEITEEKSKKRKLTIDIDEEKADLLVESGNHDELLPLKTKKKKKSKVEGITVDIEQSIEEVASLEAKASKKKRKKSKSKPRGEEVGDR
jgi:hypothetical protein